MIPSFVLQERAGRSSLQPAGCNVLLFPAVPPKIPRLRISNDCSSTKQHGYGAASKQSEFERTDAFESR